MVSQESALKEAMGGCHRCAWFILGGNVECEEQTVLSRTPRMTNMEGMGTGISVCKGGRKMEESEGSMFQK